MVLKNKTKSLKKQNTDSHRVKKKGHIKIENIQSLDYVYYCVFFKFFDCE